MIDVFCPLISLLKMFNSDHEMEMLLGCHSGSNVTFPFGLFFFVKLKNSHFCNLNCKNSLSQKVGILIAKIPKYYSLLFWFFKKETQWLLAFNASTFSIHRTKAKYKRQLYIPFQFKSLFGMCFCIRLRYNHQWIPSF